ncbi:MAG: hypothetical protein E6J74_23765 [Deltaproteobacteria bacterium]|nr:MAG: hypothetical protein E6J74_23765 [Deltaproteobacteria bacterium]
MVIQSRAIDPHWNYFVALDDDLVKLSRYVDLHEKNFDCYSIEIARILLASAAEVDVICKQLCKKVEPNSSADNINAYRSEITVAFPNLTKLKVLVPRFGLTLRPWDEWQNQGVPLWWTAYNKVKHHRHTDYEKASLKNSLNAVAGLFVVLLHLYKDKAVLGELAPNPQLLTLEHVDGMSITGAGINVSYALDR